MNNEDSKLVQEILADHSRMKSGRTAFEEQWNEVIDRALPRYAGFGRGRETPGQKKTERIFDSTPQLAMRHFAAAMDSMITPRTQKWHGLTISDRDLRELPSVKQYLENVTDTLFAMRYQWRSNFAPQIGESYVGYGAFGCGGLMIEDVPGVRVRYRNIRMSRLFFSEDAGGLVDKAHIEWRLTARQAAQKWSKDDLPDVIKNVLERNPEQEFDFVHSIRPRTQRDTSRVDSRNMAWQSVWICVQGNSIVEHGGFRTMPIAIGRFYTADDSAYGYSPAMDVLPDIKMLNEMERTNIRSAQKAVDPPLLLAEDGALEGFDLRSGALNYGGLDERGNQLVRPLELGKNVSIGVEYANQKREAVNLGFYVSLFQILVDNHQMTATEVLQRAQEKGILLAPTMGRVQSEKLGPMIERELDIAQAAGMLPEMPQELVDAGGIVEIEYSSPLNRAMRAEESTATLRWLEAISPLAQVDQQVVAVPNGVEIARGLADSFGVPSRYVNDPKDTDDKIAADQAVMQSAQLLEAAPVAASAAKDMTQAVANVQNSRI